MQSARIEVAGPWGLVGFCMGLLVVAALLPSVSFERLSPGVLRLEPARGTSIDAMNLRQLRALPAVGHGRALSILTARPKGVLRTASTHWLEAPGIGPRTRATLEGWSAAGQGAGKQSKDFGTHRNAERASN